MKSKKLKCFKCLNVYEDPTFLKIPKPYFHIQSFIDGTGFVKINLCPKCREELSKWLGMDILLQ